MEITTVYQKERHEFGRHCGAFGETSVTIIDEFPPEKELMQEHIERSPTILDIQATADMSEIYINTETVTYKAQGMLHLEGGWPKDVDYTEKDQTTCAARHGARARRSTAAWLSSPRHPTALPRARSLTHTHTTPHRSRARALARRDCVSVHQTVQEEGGEGRGVH